MKKLILIGIFWSSTSFSAPKCLEKNIEFWEKVYTEYSENVLLFHDSDTFEIHTSFEVEVDNVNKKAIIQSEFSVLENTLNSELLENVRIQRGAKEKWQEAHINSKKYLPMIKKVFKKHEIPSYISYLPYIESSFNPKAGSRVGAKGLWQIMPQTARSFGAPNQRRLYEPKFATNLATKILVDNYNSLGDWDLAVNAYHSGKRNMEKAIEQTGSRDICVILKEYKGKSFKFASKNYLAQFYAALKILKKDPSIDYKATARSKR